MGGVLRERRTLLREITKVIEGGRFASDVNPKERVSWCCGYRQNKKEERLS